METNKNQNFKHLDKYIFDCPEVAVSKRSFLASLFAPKFKVMCKSTGEVMKHMSETYAMVDGNEIIHVIETGKMLESHHFSPSPNGNVMVNLYYTESGYFLMVQVERFVGFGYQPVTEVAVFKDRQAKDILHLFI